LFLQSLAELINDKRSVQTSYNVQRNLSSFLEKILSRMGGLYNIVLAQKQKRKGRRIGSLRMLRVRKTLKDKKIIEKKAPLILRQNKEFFSLLTGSDVSIFFVNALAFSKYGFRVEKGKNVAQRFLQNIEREMINRFKYIATYIKDLIQVSFISLFMQKPNFLANFVAFQITKLPRNRKETKLIHFIIKTIKVFAAQREDILGLRIRFKGRVNR
jgi:hypothetical protein